MQYGYSKDAAFLSRTLILHVCNESNCINNQIHRIQRYRMEFSSVKRFQETFHC